jgi:hypothetical protein
VALAETWKPKNIEFALLPVAVEEAVPPLPPFTLKPKELKVPPLPPVALSETTTWLSPEAVP